jgi:hypothetical protein
MSLLPIIYTSLLIFSIVMTVILVVSYISYKAKRRNSEPQNSIYENPVHNAALVISRPNYTKPQPAAVPVPVTVNFQPVRTQYNETRRASTVSIQQRAVQEQRRESREIPSRRRFQVMNNTSNEYIGRFQSSGMGGFATVPAPEFNFLNYYSDQKEEKLNHISVNKFKKLQVERLPFYLFSPIF